MFKLASMDKYMNGRGTTFIVPSLVKVRRDHATLRAAMGEQVEIDGVVYDVRGYEMRLPNFDIFIGEPIGVLVK